MSVRMRWLGVDEVALGQGCIHTLWKAGHVLARDPGLFAWQFRAGPVPGSLGFLVAEDGDRAVGCIGMISLPCHRYGEPFPGAAMTTFIVDPAQRGSALGLAMMREAYGSLGLVGSIGINPRVARLYKMLGQHILVMPRYLCLANPEAMAALLRHSANADGLTMDRYAACSTLAIPPDRPGFTAAPFSPDDLEAWDRAWSDRFAPRLQGVVRDAAYLRWRYFEHPVFCYEPLLVRDRRNAIQGMAVLRRIPLPGEVSALRVLDFLAANEDAGQALARAVACRTPESAAFVEYACLGRNWRPLEAMGLSPRGAELFSVYFSPPDFAHCSITGALLVNLPGVDQEAFITSPDTHLTLADGDQDRPN